MLKIKKTDVFLNKNIFKNILHYNTKQSNLQNNIMFIKDFCVIIKRCNSLYIYIYRLWSDHIALLKLL